MYSQLLLLLRRGRELELLLKEFASSPCVVTPCLSRQLDALDTVAEPSDFSEQERALLLLALLEDVVRL